MGMGSCDRDPPHSRILKRRRPEPGAQNRAKQFRRRAIAALWCIGRMNNFADAWSSRSIWRTISTRSARRDRPTRRRALWIQWHPSAMARCFGVARGYRAPGHFTAPRWRQRPPERGPAWRTCRRLRPPGRLAATHRDRIRAVDPPVRLSSGRAYLSRLHFPDGGFGNNRGARPRRSPALPLPEDGRRPDARHRSGFLMRAKAVLVRALKASCETIISLDPK